VEPSLPRADQAPRARRPCCRLPGIANATGATPASHRQTTTAQHNHRPFFRHPLAIVPPPPLPPANRERASQELPLTPVHQTKSPHAPTSLLSSPTERHRRQPRKTIATTGQTTATFASRTPHNISLASAITTGPPFFPSGLVIDRHLPHNTPPIPPKCLPQSSNAAASPSPKG
jgi:hypothetical protein